MHGTWQRQVLFYQTRSVICLHTCVHMSVALRSGVLCCFLEALGLASD